MRIGTLVMRRSGNRDAIHRAPTGEGPGLKVEIAS